VAILLTAMVKDTGGMTVGRSASLQSAEQNAHQIDDEYGGHSEARGAVRISAYEIRDDTNLDDEDRDPKEVERDRVGADVDKFNLGLFGAGAPAPLEPIADEPSEIDAFNDAVAAVGDAPDAGFASHAAAFHEAPITPE